MTYTKAWTVYDEARLRQLDKFPNTISLTPWRYRALCAYALQMAARYARCHGNGKGT